MKTVSPAKINIFLKIVGIEGRYHKIVSRFIKIDTLYDVIEFKKSDRFDIVGDFGCAIEDNTIYKAYKILSEIEPKVESFFKNYKIVVEKNIPKFSGLGGGSSNAASFLLLCNEVLDLNLTKKELHDIGKRVGADVLFFLSEFKSANVSGIGEVVDEFEEESLAFEIFTPNISCSTKEVYSGFRENYLDKIDIEFAKELMNMKSLDILNRFCAYELNDLLYPALDLYPKLKGISWDKWFFSGSGSSLFRRVDG